MTIKHCMQQYAGWQATLANKMAELQNIERDCILPSGISYDTDRVQSSAGDDGLLRIILQMDERKRTTINQITAIRGKMQQFEDTVDKMPTGKYKRLIHLYYIEGYKTLEEVAKKMGYSLDRINHMHGEALQEAEKVFEIDKN